VLGALIDIPPDVGYAGVFAWRRLRS